MIYDVGIYDVEPRKVGDYMAAVRDVGWPVRRDHGIKLAGWYYSDVGPLNQAVHIWAHDGLEEMERAEAAARSDPRWINEYRPRIWGILVGLRDQLMRAADFSPPPPDPGQPSNPDMVYDLRIYDLQPGAVPEYMKAVQEVGLPVRQEHDVKLAGWYYSEKGPLHQVMHIWAYRGWADLDQKTRAVRNDSRWTKEYVPRVTPLIRSQRDQLMLGADFFPGPR